MLFSRLLINPPSKVKSLLWQFDTICHSKFSIEFPAILCSIVNGGDILVVPLAELSGTDHLLATLYTVNKGDLHKDVVYFKVASIKPQGDMPVMIDPKHTRVVLQVSVSAQTVLASSEVRILWSAYPSKYISKCLWSFTATHCAALPLKKGQMSEIAYAQSIVHVASLYWRQDALYKNYLWNFFVRRLRQSWICHLLHRAPAIALCLLGHMTFYASKKTN